MADLQTLQAAIEAGNRVGAVQIVTDALEAGASPQALLDSMTAAMKAVGDRFSRNEVFVPEMLISARSMKAAMSVLEPVLVEAGIEPDVTAVLGTVEGDLHDIGKNLVGMMWKGANFAVVDLGTNVSPEAFVRAAVEHNASIIGVSALLTTTMVNMGEVVKAVRASERPDVPIILGGAPVNEEFARSIGADGYASDAAAAVAVARAAIAARSAATA